MLRFLIDECLSPDLTAIARSRGHLALHVEHLGRLGAKDEKLVSYALANEMIVVTNNGRDFIRLLSSETIHPGLIVILPSAGLSRQEVYFNLALNAVETIDDPINTLIEVHANGHVDVRSWPA